MSVMGNGAVGQLWQTVSFAAVETVTVSAKASSVDFGSIIAEKMNGKLNNVDSSEPVSTNKKPVQMAADETKVDKVSSTTKKESTEVVADDKAIDSDKTLGSEMVDIEDTNEVCKEVLDVIESLLAQFAQILDVTVNELEEAFEQLDIKLDEMLDTKNISALVLTLNGSDNIADMLVDYDLLDEFNQIKSLVNETLETVNATLDNFSEVVNSDEFKELLADDNTPLAGVIKNILPNTKDSTGETSNKVEDVKTEGKEVEVTYTIDKQVTTSNDKGDFSGSSESNLKDDKLTGKSISTKDKTSFITTSESFVNSLTEAVKASPIEELTANMDTSIREIVFQLVDAIKVDISVDKTSLEMQLNPENLGKVQLNISSKDGVMTAHITTENQVAKEAIESQMQILKDTITEQGIKVDAIEVTVSSFSFADSKNAEQQGQNNEEARKSHKNVSISGVDKSVDTEGTDKLRQEVMRDSGSTVDYVA